MSLPEKELKQCREILTGYIESRRPPAHLREKVDLDYRIERHSIVIFDIRPFWQDKNKKIETPIAKATFVKKTGKWKIYWMRADLKWHLYKPDPEADSISEFLAIVDEDEYSCFWG